MTIAVPTTLPKKPPLPTNAAPPAAAASLNRKRPPEALSVESAVRVSPPLNVNQPSPVFSIVPDPVTVPVYSALPPLAMSNSSVPPDRLKSVASV